MPECCEVRSLADKMRLYVDSKIISGACKGKRAITRCFDNLKCPVTIIGIRSHGKKLIIDSNDIN